MNRAKIVATALAAAVAVTATAETAGVACPYEPSQPTCLGKVCIAEARGLLFVAGGWTDPGRSSQKGYRDTFEAVAGRLFSAATLLSGFAAKNCEEKTKRAASLLAGVSAVERKVRREFVENFRVDGKRVTEDKRGWTITTPRGKKRFKNSEMNFFYNPNTGVTTTRMPPEMGKFVVDEKALFPPEFDRAMDGDFLVRWAGMFRHAVRASEAGLHAGLLALLKDSLSGGAIFSEGRKIFENLEIQRPVDMSDRDFMDRLTDTLIRLGRGQTGLANKDDELSMRDSDVWQLLKFSASRSQHEFLAPYLEGLSACESGKLEELLEALDLIERAALIKREASILRPGAPRPAVDLYIESTHWIANFAMVDAFRETLAKLVVCKRAYPLIRRLYLAYEISRIAVDVDLYLELLEAGKSAFQGE